MMAMVLAGTSLDLKAQDGPTRYLVIDYMKVQPENWGEYVQLERTWKKLHEERIKAGKLDGWVFDEIITPSGTSQEYNFITINHFLGEEKLAAFYEDSMMPEGWQSMFTLDEIDLMMRTNELRDIVKTEVYAVAEQLWAGDDDGPNSVRVVNFFKNHAGYSNADHTALEAAMWKPVHQARMDDDRMEGWVVANRVMPLSHGTMAPYHSITIDFYKDMHQLMQPMEMGRYLEQVHEGKEAQELMDEMGEVVSLLHSYIRRHIDSAMPENNSAASSN